MTNHALNVVLYTFEIYLEVPDFNRRAHGGESAVAELPVPKAPRLVVVDEAHGLHEGVHGGGPHESETPLLQVLAELHTGFGPAVGLAADDRLTLDEAPDVRVK